MGCSQDTGLTDVYMSCYMRFAHLMVYGNNASMAVMMSSFLPITSSPELSMTSANLASSSRRSWFARIPIRDQARSRMFPSLPIVIPPAKWLIVN